MDSQGYSYTFEKLRNNFSSKKIRPESYPVEADIEINESDDKTQTDALEPYVVFT
jgi:hypothetical protein